VRFFVDENVDARLVPLLRERGHDAIRSTVRPGAGADDLEVLRTAAAEDRVLIANDQDFADLVYRRRLAHAGVILFRLRSQSLSGKEDALARVLSAYPERLADFVVVTEDRIRLRRAMS
jgi:predicted nuclease of predicted toxin-antitoxin system